MKSKIGLGILVLLVIAAAYGTTQLMPIISLLKEVDVSEFAPPVIEEEEVVDNIASGDSDSRKNVDNLMDDDSESPLTNVDNSKNDLNLENNISEKGGDSVKSNAEESRTEESKVEKTKTEKSSPQKDKKTNISSTNRSNISSTKETISSKDIAVSGDKISSVEKEISFADKAKALKLILTNLSASDIKVLKELASGGLTPEEKAKAVQIAYSKYSEEEIKLIKELYSKYVGK